MGNGAVESPSASATLMDYLRVVRRRKWTIVAALIVVPAVAAGLALRKPAVYEASAAVLLSQQNLAAALAGTPDQSSGLSATAQATLAQVPALAQRVVNHAGVPGATAGDLLAQSSVAGDPVTNILTFSVRDGDPAAATKLANAFARQYTQYRLQLDTASLENARQQIVARISALKKTGKAAGSVYDNLVENEQRLATWEALQTANASVIRTATGAGKIGPRPQRDALLGLMLGLVLGVGLAFAREAFDTRVRAAEDVARVVELPLLARLPEPPKALRESNGLAMVAEPAGPHAESFRILRTNLEFAMLDREVRSLMVTSSVEQEGKTTTICNLALALARSGQRVALVDLDLRRPAVDRFFDLRGRPGLTQVAIGRASLADALVRVPIADTAALLSDADARSFARASPASTSGRLYVIGSGPVPPDPGEFVSTQALSDVLAAVRSGVDLVLLDAPPLLHAGDAMALSTRVDALVLVARLERIRRSALAETRRLMDAMPVLKLGYVTTGARVDDDYVHGYRNYYTQRVVEEERAR